MEALYVRTYRKKKRLTQNELGEILGVSRRTIINWENCKKKMSKKNKEKIQEIFNSKNNIKINRENLTEKQASYKKI